MIDYENKMPYFKVGAEKGPCGADNWNFSITKDGYDLVNMKNMPRFSMPGLYEKIEEVENYYALLRAKELGHKLPEIDKLIDLWLSTIESVYDNELDVFGNVALIRPKRRDIM